MPTKHLLYILYLKKDQKEEKIEQGDKLNSNTLQICSFFMFPWFINIKKEA